MPQFSEKCQILMIKAAFWTQFLHCLSLPYRTLYYVIGFSSSAESDVLWLNRIKGK